MAMPCRQPSFSTAGYARGSGLALRFRAKARAGGIAPDFIRTSTARQSLASHRAAKLLRQRRRVLQSRCFENVQNVSLPKVQSKSEWVLTQDAFDGFLATLDRDRDKAG